MSIRSVPFKLRTPVIESVFGYRRFLYNYKNNQCMIMYHLGRDYGAPVGTPVYTIGLPGVVVFAGEIDGFGALAPKPEPGGAIIIKHKLCDEEFHALYGHVNIHGSVIEGIEIGEKPRFLGTLNAFKNYDLDESSVIVLPHCHFGIWLTKKSIEGRLGYDSQIRYWVDPDEFLRNPCDFCDQLKYNNN